jgi:hypothetical protein
MIQSAAGSTIEGEGYSSKAIDGDTSVWNYWHSLEGVPQWLELTLGSSQAVCSHAFMSRSHNDYAEYDSPTAWHFQAWAGSSWTTVSTETGQYPWDGAQTKVFSNPPKFRLYVTEVGGRPNGEKFVNMVGESNNKLSFDIAETEETCLDTACDSAMATCLADYACTQLLYSARPCYADPDADIHACYVTELSNALSSVSAANRALLNDVKDYVFNSECIDHFNYASTLSGFTPPGRRLARRRPADAYKKGSAMVIEGVKGINGARTNNSKYALAIATGKKTVTVVSDPSEFLSAVSDDGSIITPHTDGSTAVVSNGGHAITLTGADDSTITTDGGALSTSTGASSIDADAGGSGSGASTVAPTDAPTEVLVFTEVLAFSMFSR